MLIKDIITESKILLEGGNMFSDATDFDQKYAANILKVVNGGFLCEKLEIGRSWIFRFGYSG